MTEAEIIPFRDPKPVRTICTFCEKEIPKGTMALVSNDKRKWMCRSCIQEAHIRMGAAG